MVSYCKTCMKELSISANNCTNCGDVDPFNKVAILDLEKSLGMNYITSNVIPSVIVGISSPLLAIANHSWMIFFIGVGIMGYINRESFSNEISYDTNLESLYRQSFKNYLLSNKNQSFENDFIAQKKYNEDMFSRSGGIYTKLRGTEEIFN